MAYIPKDDSQQQSGSTMQVYGSGQQQGESAQDMGSTPTTNASGMSTNIGGSSAQGGQQSLGPMSKQTSGPKPKTEARSGMFTNIRKYVQANQPKAQQMGQKVSQGFQQKTGNIRNQFQQQQTQFQQQVEQNRKRMQEAEQFGQEQIDQAGNVTAQPPLSRPTRGIDFRQQYGQIRDMRARSPWEERGLSLDEWIKSDEYSSWRDRVNGGSARGITRTTEGMPSKIAIPSQAQQPSQDDIKRFQQLTSNQAGFGDIGYDVGAQQREAQELQRSAESLDREEGLRRGLQSTFGAGREAYTQGMSGLDQMILGANKDVREQMATSAQQSAEALTGDIGEARKQALRDLSQLELGGTQLAESLKESLGAKQDEIRQLALDAQSKGVAFQNELKKFLAGETETISKDVADALGLSEGQLLYGRDRDFIDTQLGSSIGSFMDMDSRARLSALEDLAGQKDQMLASSTGQEYKSQEDRESSLSDYLASESSAFQKESEPVIQEINRLDEGLRHIDAAYAIPGDEGNLFAKRMAMNHPMVWPFWDGNQDLSAYNGALQAARRHYSQIRSMEGKRLEEMKSHYGQTGAVKYS
jgi:hypothetical protein